MNSPITNAAPASSGQVVVFPPDRGIGVLAVAPPYPVGFKPQNDGALGININMVHGDRDGLLVYILAYLNMAIGDNIKVYIETKNAPVAEFPVTEAHFDAEGKAKNIPFYISAQDMEARFLPLQPENKDFWFEVLRVSGNGTEQSPPVPMFYKYPAPGEADTDGGKPFNQGLKLPIASESVVDQTVIDDGMFVTVPEYFNQSIDDVVVLAFGSLLLEFTVTELGDIVFELTPEMLATLAPTNSLVVRWEVFDVVENASGWSDALMLTFKPGMVLLAAPIFEPADPDNVVNHDGLAGDAMVILVTGVFAVNDLIELTLEGLTRGGDPVTHTFKVMLVAAGRTVNFPVLNEWVRNLIGGSARASYTLTKTGKTQPSKPADATFTGTSLPLGLPIVDPLVDNKLPVDTVAATVQVAEYWPLKKGAIVRLNWQTTDQDGIKALFIFQQVVTDPTQPVIFQVPAYYIAPYASTPLVVQCTVTNPGEVEVFSQLLQLMFGDAAQIVLEPPFLVAPAKNPIESSLYPEGVKVRVEHLTAQEGDEARLEALNALPGTPEFATVKLNQNKRANFTLSPELLKAHQGRRLRLCWVLISKGVKTPSPVLRLRILLPEAALTFGNAPYFTMANGLINNVTLELMQAGEPVPHKPVVLTLPSGFTFADGGTGSRAFITDNRGVAIVGEVRAPASTGTYTLNASSDAQTASASVDVSQPSVIDWISMDSAPVEIAITSNGKHLYAPLPTSLSVAVVDTETLEIQKHIPVDIIPQAIALSSDGLRAYTCNRSNKVYEIDTVKQVVTRTIPIASERAATISVSPHNKLVYISTWEYGNIKVYNPVTGTENTSIRITESPWGITFSPDGRLIYIAVNNYSGQSARLDIVDAATHAVIKRVDLPAGSYPHYASASPDGRFVYVTLWYTGQIAIVDTTTLTVSKYITVGKKPYAVVINNQGTFAYVTNYESSTISVIETRRQEVIYTIPLGGGTVYGIALSPDGTLAYACMISGYRIAVLRIG